MPYRFCRRLYAPHLKQLASKNKPLGLRSPTMDKVRFVSMVLMVAVCILSGSETASGNLPWPAPKKEAMRLRLVALAWDHARPSFSASEEVFVSDKDLAKDETRLIKLV